MTKKDKIKEKFLNNPSSLLIGKIISFFLRKGYELIEAKGSHTKIVHKKSKKHLTIPIHNGDTKPFYKKELKRFYISNK